MRLAVPAARTWQFFVALCNELAKDFYTVHIYNTLLNRRNGEHKLCTYFLTFWIFRAFLRKSWRHLATFSNLFYLLESDFLPEKLQTSYKSAYKYRRYISCWSNPTTSPKPSNGISVTNKKHSEKHQTLSSHTDVCHSISTKLCNCMMIEEIHAIVESPNLLDLISSLAARGHRKCVWKCPHRA